jgi:sulfur carrier protein
MSLSLIINGQTRVFEELAPGASVLHLVEVLELKGDRVALELNGEIAPRSEWSEASLNDGDKIEMVHFVGGG